MSGERNAPTTGSGVPSAALRRQWWFWRSGYFWNRGITIKRGRKGVAIGIQWPPVIHFYDNGYAGDGFDV